LFAYPISTNKSLEKARRADMSRFGVNGLRYPINQGRSPPSNLESENAH